MLSANHYTTSVDMWSVGLLDQWVEYWEDRDYWDETPERARFYANLA